MKSFLRLLFTSVCMALFVGTLAAVELGDPAPPLQIAEWIKGKPVDMAAGKGDTIYVIDFWATWCPPCIENIPDTTELQKKFMTKNVVFIGISSEDVGTVKRFVARQGQKMDYRVAVDDQDKTISAFAGDPMSVTLPLAYIVDKAGRIVWQTTGYPMFDLERTLEEILAGTFTIELGRKRNEARQKLRDFYQLASTTSDEQQLAKEADELEKLDKEVGGITPDKTFSAAELLRSIKFDKALRAYQQAIFFNKDASEVENLDAEMQDLAPQDFDLAGFKSKVNLAKTFDRYYLAVTAKSDTNQIVALGEEISATKVTDARLLNQFAWIILTDERIQFRNLELAAQLARAAIDATDTKDVVPIHTYARALFMQGKPADAVLWEKKAVKIADDDRVRQQLEAAVKEYEAAATK